MADSIDDKIPLRVPGFMPMYCMGAGSCLWIAHNAIQSRPLTARFPLLGLYLVGGYVFGQAVSDYKLKRARERDLVILDYVKRHPEDFPELAPKKYKDVLNKWTPQR